MDMEYVKLFVLGLGGVVGFPVIKFIWRVAGEWRAMADNVVSAKKTSERTEITVNGYGARIGRIEQTLHGPEGNNGLFQSVREIERRLFDTTPNPGRRKTDVRKRRLA